MKIGILMAGHVMPALLEKHRDYDEQYRNWFHLADPSVETKPYFVTTGDWPRSPNDCDAWVITGSAAGVYEDHDWIEPLKAFIRNCGETRVPLAGFCFGHQIIAEAYDGKVVKSDKGWGISTYQSAVKKRPNWFANAANKVRFLYMHQDQVVEKPTNATVLVSHDFCPFAGLAYDKPAISFQGHPEFTQDYASDLVRARAGKLFEKDFAEERLKEVDLDTSAAQLAHQVLAFFRNPASA